MEDETEDVFFDACTPLLAATEAGELYSARVSITPLVVRIPLVLVGGTVGLEGEREGRTAVARLVGGCIVSCCMCRSVGT